MNALTELLSIPPHIFFLVCFTLCFIISSMKDPEGSLFDFLKHCNQGTHLVTLLLKIPWKHRECGGQPPISFFWPAQTFSRGREGPFPSLISALAVSRLWFQALGIYQLGFGWRKKVPIRNTLSCLMIQRWKQIYMHNLLHSYLI